MLVSDDVYNILMLILWALLFFYSVLIAKNFFSPPVMFSGILGVFYADLFLNNHELNLLAIYLSMLCIVVIGTYPYIKKYNIKSVNSEYNTKINTKHFPAVRLWILAVPAIVCQLYMIFDFGGIAGYLIAAKFGTREFYGLGPLKTIISSVYPLGMICFCYYINSSQELRKKFFVSMVLFQMTVIVFAILTLSRGTLLNYFIIMMICWSVLVKKISPKFILAALTLVLAMASVYGVVRETFSVDGGDFKFGLEGKDELIKTEWTEFGTFPLKKVLQPNSNEYSYGLTYVTVFTNFIPRSIWPNKPDPGGVIFTRDYAPGLYDEFNQYTTGLMPEAIINFGIIVGTLFGLIQLFVLIYFSSIVSIRLKTSNIFNEPSSKKIYYTVAYAYFLWAAPFFLTGEFTNVAIGLIIKFIYLYLYYLFLTKKINF